MNVKITLVRPEIKAKMKLMDFANWDSFTGITEEQEERHKKTYVDYILNEEKTKHIFICLN